MLNYKYNYIQLLFLVMISVCFVWLSGLTTKYIQADDSAVWKTAGLVLECIENSGSKDKTNILNEELTKEFNINTEDYRLTDINILAETSSLSAAFSQTTSGDNLSDVTDPTIFCSAKLSYDPSIYSVDDILAKLESSDCIIHADIDRTLYSDAIFPGNNSDMNNSNQWYLDTIGARKAWGLLDEEPGKGVVVAVIDTGVDYTHKELKSSMWVNEAEAEGISGIDDDGNGVIDDIYGANFSSDNSNPLKRGNPYDTDKDGHGTHVAGIIAMANGNGGGCGIAYGSRIMAVKAGNSDGSFKVSSVIAALDYAVNMGADVINMSFGTYTESSVFKSMLEKICGRCVLVAAAGNDGYVTTDQNNENAHNVYPASYPCVIGVMASDVNNSVTSWSNYDGEHYTDAEYEIAAPGYYILSTMPSGKYAYMNGTSMAAPMVSGAAAVLYGIIDRQKITDPALYIYGQLTQATTHTAVRTDSEGNAYTYPLLNICDSLTNTLNNSEGVDININRFNYYYNQGAVPFDKELEIDGNSATINCGFRINNLWSEAKDITVNVKADSEMCTNTESETDIAYMPAISSITVSCQSMETYTFEFNCRDNGTYNIPIVYTVKAQAKAASASSGNADSKEGEYTFEYRDMITVKVNKKADTGGDNSTSADSNTQSSDNSTGNTNGSIIGADQTMADGSAGSKAPAKVKITRVKSVIRKIRKNTIVWKKSSGAKKYVIYYSTRRKGTYTKLATTSKLRYTHTFKKNKTYYYKVRAYSVYKGKKVYGKYSAVVKI